MHRSIVVEKVGNLWIFVFLYAKKDRENIEDDELAAFKELADMYAKLTEDVIEKAIKSGKLLEIENHG